MNFFILGFHRLVRCPKWTPASSISLISGIGILLLTLSPSLPSSTLAELEAAARARAAVFLAFHRARIARQEPVLPQCLPELRLVGHQGPGNPQPHRAGL